MTEVQIHGFSFEKWVKREFFGDYSGGYMQHWDVPAEHNRSQVLPSEFRNLPVSIKTAKVGSPIGLGDVLRQRNINSTFVLIAGFWEQRTASEKYIRLIGAALVTPEKWRRLWSPITVAQLQELDAVVKDRSAHYSDARVAAQAMKTKYGMDRATIVINPKIDSGVQRRVQCSLPYGAFWQLGLETPEASDNPVLWTRPFSNPIRSGRRIL